MSNPLGFCRVLFIVSAGVSGFMLYTQTVINLWPKKRRFSKNIIK